MIIKAKTLQLAKEKGFKPNQVETYYNPMSGYTSYKEDVTRQYQLQNYILENGLFVSVELAYNKWGRFAAKIEKKAKDDKTAIIVLDGFTVFNTYEEAFEEGLYEALKLI